MEIKLKIFFFVVTTFFNGIHTEDEEIISSLYKDLEYGKSWFYFPDSSGQNVKVFANDNNLVGRIAFGKHDVIFNLYRKDDPKYGKRISFEENEYQTFNPNIPTKILVHGWLNDVNSPSVQQLKDNYLEIDDFNVIIVDWSKRANNVLYNYPAAQTLDVGKYLSKLIDNLVKNKGANLSSFHLIGHSLGAHVVGNAGYYITSGKIPRITGLDPAWPLFDSKPDSEKLSIEDASFVDVVHTNGKRAGIYDPIGHVDFYVNGGKFQPNCDILHCCSHSRAYKYYAASILNPTGFRGKKCHSLKMVEEGVCTGRELLMGLNTSAGEIGLFLVKTSGTAPYALE